MSKSQSKRERVRKELAMAGVTPYGLQKSESKALYDYLSKDEHVLAAIYGQHDSTSAMMVATTKRLFFIDIRQFQNITDEASYDVFGDINVMEGVAFATVDIRTKPRNYHFTMVNKRCARKFLNVVEKLAIDPLAPQASQEYYSTLLPSQPDTTTNGAESNPEEISFLQEHSIATLSTRGENGYPHGVTIYYFHDKSDPNHIYHVTKSSTHTAMNIRRNQKVAFTITDLKKMTTMNIDGVAELERRPDKKNQIVGLLFTYQKANSPVKLPPLAKIKQGSFVVYRTHIKAISLRRYDDPS